MTLFARMVGGALGVQSGTIEAMLEAYTAELTQVRYTPEYADYQRQQKAAILRKQAKKKLDDDALLRKLEGMTDKG